MKLRERERHLQEEVTMRRALDEYTQRQLYEFVKTEQELKKINRDQLEELTRLSALLGKAATDGPSPPAAVRYESDMVSYTAS